MSASLDAASLQDQTDKHRAAIAALEELHARVARSCGKAREAVEAAEAGGGWALSVYASPASTGGGADSVSLTWTRPAGDGGTVDVCMTWFAEPGKSRWSAGSRLPLARRFAPDALEAATVVDLDSQADTRWLLANPGELLAWFDC